MKKAIALKFSLIVGSIFLGFFILLTASVKDSLALGSQGYGYVSFESLGGSACNASTSNVIFNLYDENGSPISGGSVSGSTEGNNFSGSSTGCVNPAGAFDVTASAPGYQTFSSLFRFEPSVASATNTVINAAIYLSSSAVTSQILSPADGSTLTSSSVSFNLNTRLKTGSRASTVDVYFYKDGDAPITQTVAPGNITMGPYTFADGNHSAWFEFRDPTSNGIISAKASISFVVNTVINPSQPPPAPSATPSPSPTPTPSSYLLTVNGGGNGSGTVTSGDGKISITYNGSTTAGTSIATYLSSPVTTVSLTASPSPGSIFNSWTGCQNSASTTISVTMDASYTCTANFHLGTASPTPPTPTPTSTPAPGAPTLSFSDVFCNRFTVNWTVSAGATNYQLEFTHQGQAANVFSVGNVQTWTFYSDVVSANQTYFVRVSAFNGAWGAWSNMVTVTTPSCAANSDPANLTPNIICNSDGNSFNVSLSWDPAVNAAGYAINMTNDSTFGSVPASWNVSSSTSSYTFSNLPFYNPSTNALYYYYWRVRANVPLESVHPWIYPTSTQTAPGTPFSKAGCGGVIFGSKQHIPEYQSFGSQGGEIPPGATVTVIRSSDNKTVLSDDPTSGLYFVKALDPGNYIVSASGVSDPPMTVFASVSNSTVAGQNKPYTKSAAGWGTSVTVTVASTNNGYPGGIGELNVWFYYENAAAVSPTPTPTATPTPPVGGRESPTPAPSSSPGIPPTDATSLSVSTDCTGPTTSPNVVFSWTNPAGSTADQYFIGVSTDNFATNNYGWKMVPAASPTTSFSWDSGSPMVKQSDGTSTFVPANSQTYYWRVIGYNSVTGQYSPDTVYFNGNGNGGTINQAQATTFTTLNCTPPADATNLNAALSCSGPSNTPQVVFTWTNPLGSTADTYFIGVSENAGFSPLGWASKAYTSTIYTWDSGSALTGGPPTVPVGGTNYYWRIVGYNSVSNLYGNYVTYNANPIKAQDCGNDLDVSNDATDPESSVKLYKEGCIEPSNSFNVGDKICAKVTTKNLGSTNSGAFNIGFYTGSPAVSLNPCPASNPAPGAGFSKAISGTGLAPGGVDVFTTPSFDAPREGSYTAYGFADYDCQVNETNERNNVQGVAYVVGSKAFYITNDGDVASGDGAGGGGLISLKADPGADKFQSSYILAGQTLTYVKTRKWSISGYSQPFVTSKLYNYLVERFQTQSKLTNAPRGSFDPPNACQISVDASGGTGSNLTSHMFYCYYNAYFSSTSIAPTGDTVWFVNGDLNISSDLVLAQTDTLTLVVKGKITVETGVKRVDAILISGSEFDSASAGNNVSLDPLTINGGVFAPTVNLIRTLQVGSDTNPSEIINFDPKYIIKLPAILGTPAITWTEIAP